MEFIKGQFSDQIGDILKYICICIYISKFINIYNWKMHDICCDVDINKI